MNRHNTFPTHDMFRRMASRVIRSVIVLLGTMLSVDLSAQVSSQLNFWEEGLACFDACMTTDLNLTLNVSSPSGERTCYRRTESDSNAFEAYTIPLVDFDSETVLSIALGGVDNWGTCPSHDCCVSTPGEADDICKRNELCYDATNFNENDCCIVGFAECASPALWFEAEIDGPATLNAHSHWVLDSVGGIAAKALRTETPLSLSSGVNAPVVDVVLVSPDAVDANGRALELNLKTMVTNGNNTHDKLDARGELDLAIALGDNLPTDCIPECVESEIFDESEIACVSEGGCVQNSPSFFTILFMILLLLWTRREPNGMRPFQTTESKV